MVNRVKHIDSNISTDEVYEMPTTQSGIAAGEIVIGALEGIDQQGQALVDFPGNPNKIPLSAVSTLGVTKKLVGRQVALLFANGDLLRPVIMGLIHSPLHDILDTYELTPAQDTETAEAISSPSSEVDDVCMDGKRLVLEAKNEIVLKCGEASITLTKAGKILIRGNYLLNRSTGVNRIMGGSVQVN